MLPWPYLILDFRFPMVKSKIVSFTTRFIIPLLLVSAFIPPVELTDVPGGSKSGEGSCGFDGDTDSYGMGVRLGAYIQYLTSIFVYNLSPSEAASMRGVTTCFQIAMLGGLIAITITRGENLFAVEALVILLICLSGAFSSLAWPWHRKRRTSLPQFIDVAPSNIGAVIRIALGTGMCAYGVWYSFIGLDVMLHSSCTSSVFFFARINLYGWFRVLLKVSFVVGLVLCTALLLTTAVAIGLDCYEWHRDWMTAELDETDEDALLPRPYWKSVLASVAAMCVFVVVVELTLHWNTINNIYKCNSTGQLFPVIVGAAGLSRLLYVVLTSFAKGDLRFGR